MQCSLLVLTFPGILVAALESLKDLGKETKNNTDGQNVTKSLYFTPLHQVVYVCTLFIYLSVHLFICLFIYFYFTTMKTHEIVRNYQNFS